MYQLFYRVIELGFHSDCNNALNIEREVKARRDENETKGQKLKRYVGQSDALPMPCKLTAMGIYYNKNKLYDMINIITQTQHKIITNSISSQLKNLNY